MLLDFALLRRYSGADSNSSQVNWTPFFPIFLVLVAQFVNVLSKPRLKSDADFALIA